MDLGLLHGGSHACCYCVTFSFPVTDFIGLHRGADLREQIARGRAAALRPALLCRCGRRISQLDPAGSARLSLAVLPGPLLRRAKTASPGFRAVSRQSGCDDPAWAEFRRSQFPPAGAGWLWRIGWAI